MHANRKRNRASRGKKKGKEPQGGKKQKNISKVISNAVKVIPQGRNRRLHNEGNSNL